MPMPCFAILLLLAAPVIVDGVDIGGWTTEQLWEKSDQYFHDGRYAEAIRLQARIRELDPTDIEAYTVAAWLTWSLGDEPGARRLLQAAIERNPDDWEPYWELGYHLLDRVGEAAAALPYLEQALRHPPFPDHIRRTLAHAYVYAEQPARAVALWARMRAEQLAPAGVIEINQPQAVRLALRSDLLARNGGVVDGEPKALPVVLADRRRDDDGDGFAEQRLLELEDPTRLDGRADFRISYLGRRVVYKPVWTWVTMETDLDGDGRFELVIRDEDGDGIAESLPALDELRRLREECPAFQRLFAAPDRYELIAPNLAVEGAVLTARPRLLVATDEPQVRFRLALLATVDRRVAAEGSASLPGGVYWSHDGAAAPRPVVELRAEAAPPGRYLIVSELLVRGVPLDRKVAAEVAVSDGRAWRLAPAEAWETASAHLGAPEAMAEAAEAELGTGAPRKDVHDHD